jgi:hypothetical protein
MSELLDVLTLARRRLEEVRGEGASGAPHLPGPNEVVWGAKSEISAESLATALVSATPPLGEAGPSVTAWHCRIDLGSGHVRGLRPDGSSFCATCHPLEVGR